MSHKGKLGVTFEYDGYSGDPGYVELTVHFGFNPGTPETGRYSGPPENYDPGSPHEAWFDYAEREHTDPGGNKHWVRLMQGEWLEEWCQSWLASRDQADLFEGLPCRDPDDGHD